MSGQWIRRKADEHKCKPPTLGPRAEVLDPTPGDVWQCECQKTYEVVNDQRDGWYYIALGQEGRY